MKRLTDESGICVDCDGIAYCKVDCDKKRMYDKLAYYENLEEHGKLIVLPCKVGDEVWQLMPALCEHRNMDTCSDYCDGWDVACSDYIGKMWIYKTKFSVSMINSIGESIFLTREEAETAKEK